MTTVRMNLLTTLAGSMMEGFLPRGWDLARIDACCVASARGRSAERQPWWHPRLRAGPLRSRSPTSTSMLGHEIARTIQRGRDEGRPSALILPVGPMGMYRWAVYFLKEWDVACDHVHGFNMDEWSDRDGVTLPAEHPGAFQNAMESAFYGPLGDADRARVAALVRHARPPAALRRADRRAEGKRGRADRDLRDRPGLPHRLLGAAFRRGISPASTSGRPRRTGSARGCIR